MRLTLPVMNFDNFTPEPNMKTYLQTKLFCASLFCCLMPASASDLVYTPNNPSFGGNPNNAPGLMANASATKKHAESSGRGNSMLNQSPLEQFNQTLERSVISQLSSSTASKLIGSNGKLTPGSLSTANFTINIIDMGGGVLRVDTTDKATGAMTSFMVQQ